jgi:P27 family predicted phage terminase small subunit
MKRNGPPKKPTKLKIAEGTFRQDRAVQNEAQPEIAIPSAPRQLSREARREWRRLSHELYRLGLVSRIDRAALAVYCEAWSDWLDATEKVAESGKVRTTEAGNVIENPYYSIKKRAAELMHKFLTEFGMTPASRTRINAIDADKRHEDDLAAILREPRPDKPTVVN